MLSHFQDVLNVYLFPFVIAVPIAIVLYLLVTRRDEPPISELRNSRQLETDGRFEPTLPPPFAAPSAPGPTAAPRSAPQGEAPMARSAQPGGVPLSTLEAAALRSQPSATGQATGQPPAPAHLQPLAPQPAPSTTLLLVDDSAVARAKLRKLFETAGYPVEVAKDGLEALELLGKNRYALMITDLEMPQMDGVELIAAVHGSLDTEDLPILAITGHDDLQAKVHECEGLFGIFKKPWNDRELLRRVETLVRLQQQPGRATA